MAQPFLFINTYAIHRGKEQQYTKAFQEIADIVQANEPRMLYFACHASEDGSHVTTVQVHSEAENMAFHMQLVEDHIRAAMQNYIDATDMSIEIYGQPTEELLGQMRELAGSGVKVTINPPTVSFHRFDTP
jgi:transcription initiation factor IIF auxiliary subunit